jgi:hypothetical protein
MVRLKPLLSGLEDLSELRGDYALQRATRTGGRAMRRSPHVEVEGRDIPIVKLVPVRQRTVSKRSYRKLVANLKAVGLIEPLCVCEENGKYLILEGYVRYTALLEMGVETVPYLILPSRDLDTPNRRVSHLTAYQENRMLRKALEEIDENTIAEAFGIKSIKTRLSVALCRDLHPDVVAELKDGKRAHFAATNRRWRKPGRDLPVVQGGTPDVQADPDDLLPPRERDGSGVGSFDALMARFLVAKPCQITGPDRISHLHPQQCRGACPFARRVSHRRIHHLCHLNGDSVHQVPVGSLEDIAFHNTAGAAHVASSGNAIRDVLELRSAPGPEPRLLFGRIWQKCIPEPGQSGDHHGRMRFSARTPEPAAAGCGNTNLKTGSITGGRLQVAGTRCCDIAPGCGDPGAAAAPSPDAVRTD